MVETEDFRNQQLQLLVHGNDSFKDAAGQNDHHGRFAEGTVSVSTRRLGSSMKNLLRFDQLSGSSPCPFQKRCVGFACELATYQCK